MTKHTNDNKAERALYPAQLHQQQLDAQQQQPMVSFNSEDQRVARELQAKYDLEARMPMAVTAQPAGEMPFNCGNCGMMHVVRNAVHNAQFQCTRCGFTNRIAFQNARPVVILERGSWVPIPIFCNIQ